MGLAEIRAIKKMDGLYDNEKATPKVVAGLQPKEKKPIAKQSAKKKAQAGEEKEQSAADNLFYAEHWASCPHKCEACKLKLGKEPLKTLFHHLLPKSIYPAFRHVHENICVLCPQCHNQVEADIDKVPYVKKRREEALKLLLK